MTPEQEAKLDLVLARLDEINNLMRTIDTKLMYLQDDTLHQKLDELTSQVRGIDTKLMFLQDDIDETKINTQVIENTLVDGVKAILKAPNKDKEEQEKQRWHVERL